VQLGTKFGSQFTGGGFALAALDGHVIFWHQCLEYLKSKGHDVAITALEYGEQRY
jgi:hypothetical protein